MSLARDTVFAAVMLILNGVIGLSLLIGGAWGITSRASRAKGTNAALAVLAALVTLSLVLPNYTTSRLRAGVQRFPNSPLRARRVAGAVRHLRVQSRPCGTASTSFAKREIRKQTWTPTRPTPHRSSPRLVSLVLLLVSLVAVVVLGEGADPHGQSGRGGPWGPPRPLVGIVIAAVVLLPEGMAALRAARTEPFANQHEPGAGSALASIGLTIPAVAVVSVVVGKPVGTGPGAEGRSAARP